MAKEGKKNYEEFNWKTNRNLKRMKKERQTKRKISEDSIQIEREKQKKRRGTKGQQIIKLRKKTTPTI